MVAIKIKKEVLPMFYPGKIVDFYSLNVSFHSLLTNRNKVKTFKYCLNYLKQIQHPIKNTNPTPIYKILIIFTFSTN